MIYKPTFTTRFIPAFRPQEPDMRYFKRNQRCIPLQLVFSDIIGWCMPIRDYMEPIEDEL